MECFFSSRIDALLKEQVMWKIITAAVLVASIAVGPIAAQTTNVKPYVRKDGTFVQGHQRSSSNNTAVDNYSSQGNSNPYTGRSGTQNPYQQPSYGTGSSSTYRAPSYDAPKTTIVRPYVRKDGTVVKGYSRSAPKKR
jgi:hypothetical protein